MGHTQQEKAASRERIVDVTARRIREQGIERPAIAEIMREAGLTHGGFYKHFGSREELIGEAVGRAMDETAGTLAAAVDETDDPLAAIARAYLSTAHRDAPGTGCSLPALGAEMAHAGEAARGRFADQVDRYLEALQTHDGDEGDEGRRRAAVTLSAMVGGIVLARALGPTPTSDDLLATVQDAVTGHRLLPRPTPPTASTDTADESDHR